MADAVAAVKAGEGGLGRRRFLLLATGSSLALLSACSGSGQGAESVSADDRVRDEVAAAEQALVAQYQAVIDAFPDLGASLVALQEQHRAHLAAMSPGSAGSPADTAPGSGAPAASAQSARQALAALADAERAASTQRRQACLAAVDTGLARTLALIAASEASHVPALSQVPA